MGIWSGEHTHESRESGRGTAQTGPPGPPGRRGEKGNGFNLTSGGNYDISNKRLVNCADGTANKDVVNKQQMEKYVTDNRQKGDKGEKGNGFNLTPGGDYDMSNKKLVNCADGTANKDVVNKQQMEKYVTDNRQKGDKGEKGNGFNLTSGGNYDMSNKKLVNCADGTANKDVVNKQQMEKYVNDNKQPGPRGPAGSAGVGFSLTPGGDYDMKNKKLVNCADGTANKDVVNKQQMEKYVNDNKQAGPRGPAGSDGVGFSLTPGGDYDMKSKKLVNCADGTANKDVVNKQQMEKYVNDNKQAGPRGPAGSAGVGFNLTSGGDYDMKSKKLVNCGDGTGNKDAVNKQQMEKYVTDHLSHSISTNLKNDFLYIMNPNPPAGKSPFSLEEDIKWGGFVDKNLHNSVKYTAKFILTFDGANGYYSSRLGVDMHPIPVGEYTLVCEMLWDSKKIDRDNVGISATSSIETVSRQRTNKFDNHARSIIHFHKWNNPSPPNDLQLDIHIKYKLGQAYDLEVPVYIVIYGSKGYHNDIPTSVWDRAWFIEKGVFTFTEPVAVPKPVNDANPVTKYYLEKYIDGRVPRKIWYRGSLAHNNSNKVSFFANGTTEFNKKVKQSYNGDFTVNSSDTTTLYVKNAGMYMVSYTDDIKTDSGIGFIEIVISSYSTFTTDGKFGYYVEATYNKWRTKNYCFMTYFNTNDWMQIKTSNPRMALGKQTNFNRLMIIKLN